MMLSEQLQRQIAEKVARGGYESADAVVDEALRTLEARDARRIEERAWLEEKLARGIADLESGRWVDGPIFFAELEARIEGHREAAE